MNIGKIVQVMGPVVDIEFDDNLPKIKEALEIDVDNQKLIMEVAQHLNNVTVDHGKIIEDGNRVEIGRAHV